MQNKMKQSLDVHVLYVHNLKTVPCTICEKTYNRQSNLNCHYKYVHDIADNVLHMDDGIEMKYNNCEEC